MPKILRTGLAGMGIEIFVKLENTSPISRLPQSKPPRSKPPRTDRGPGALRPLWTLAAQVVSRVLFVGQRRG
ncbi:MAG: hypothetical protein ABI623_03745, partial [bacterium]